MKKALRIMFLGGVGEVGKNMTVLEYGEDIIVIDSGLAFPTDDMPGIDLVIPDITYLEQNKNRVRGIFITHGHEDHIGALPFVLRTLNVPVYGTKLALTLIENKLIEHRINNSKLLCVKGGSIITAGCFSVEFITVTHSIAGCCALAIKTPEGVIFHSGDFKIDYTPVSGDLTDIKRMAEIGDRGVLLMMCESTNVERDGYAMSESKVGESLDRIFAENIEHRIIIATFSSNIHRLQQIVNLAKKYNRKVCFSGRSMINIVESASKIGELDFDKSIIIPVDKIKNHTDKEIVILSTGSQGEPMSALTRMSQDEFQSIKIGENDTIVLSASPIPGNEKMVYNVINNLYRKGARVIYSMLADVHVSGHACREELKLMHRLIKPKFFVPIHGEFRHLKQHSELAQKLGMAKQNIFIPDIGNTLEVSKSKIAIRPNIQAGSLLIDGLGVSDVGSIELKERVHLSEDGLVVVVASISTVKNKVKIDTEIITRGFVFPNSQFANEAKEIVKEMIAAIPKENFIIDDVKNLVRKGLKNYIYKKTKSGPIIIPVIMSN